jgi:hypothetical protein
MRLPALLALTLIFVSPASAQTNADLEAKIEALAAELESLQLQDVMPAVGEGRYGLGPAASKVYSKDQGLSIGGYGEGLYRDDGANDFDWYRLIMHFGYRFDEHWLLNTEIELEHVGEVFVEVAYLDYLGLTENMNLRAGLMLNPMGLLNEYHEPTTYLAADRSQTESVIIPSTWRENGVGIFGEAGGFDYKLYYMTGLDGEGFTDTSLRGGRQKGAEALAEDFALVAAANYVEIPGVRIGGSIYSGDSGQNQGNGDMATDIFELHAEYKSGPWWGRALYADASVTDRTVGDIDLSGTYVELGYDLMSESDSSLFPFVRYEEIEATGGDREITTIGVHYRPINQVVFKLDRTKEDGADDTVSFVIGYVF